MEALRRGLEGSPIHSSQRYTCNPPSPPPAVRTRNILDDFREAYYWLRQNTDEHVRVMSWWDYGYQIAGMANRTTLVDNNTWNNSHIALVSRSLSHLLFCARPCCVFYASFDFLNNVLLCSVVGFFVVETVHLGILPNNIFQ